MARLSVALAAVALGLLVWLLFFWGLGDAPLYTVGEPREALQVVETFERGEWILPLRNGSELPSKPPLFHWLAALLALAAGRVDEWVMRAPAALLAAATVLAIACYGARRWDAAAGLGAGFILATSVDFIRLARHARVDMALAAATTAACLAFERSIASAPPPPLMLWGFYLGLSAATLAKGPVGLTLPLLIAAAYLAARGELGRWRELRVGRGLLVALAPPALWYALATLQGGMGFVDKQLVRENVLRAIGTGAARVNESHSIFYYGKALLGGFAPWSVFLLPLAIYLVHHRRHPDVVRPYLFPLLWLLIVLAFYTLMAGKRAPYILSAYPAAALMLGAWWSALERQPGVLPPSVRRILFAAVAVVTAATGVIVLMLILHGVGLDPLEWMRPLLHHKDQLNLPLIRTALAAHAPAAAAWTVCAAAGTWLLLTGTCQARWRRVFAAVVLYAGATTVVLNRSYYPLLAADRTYAPFARDVARLTDDGEPLFFFGAFDYGVVFYARRHIPALDRALPADNAWVIFTAAEWSALSDAQRARGQIAARSTGTGPEARAPLLLVHLAASG